MLRSGPILKRKLVVRHAWQIGPNDPDFLGIAETDDLLIPAEHADDAPILAFAVARQASNSRRASRRHGPLQEAGSPNVTGITEIYAGVPGEALQGHAASTDRDQLLVNTARLLGSIRFPDTQRHARVLCRSA